MLINLWYVAEWSDAVKDKPVKTKVIGQDLAVIQRHQRAGEMPGERMSAPRWLARRWLG